MRGKAESKLAHETAPKVEAGFFEFEMSDVSIFRGRGWAGRVISWHSCRPEGDGWTSLSFMYPASASFVA